VKLILRIMIYSFIVLMVIAFTLIYAFFPRNHQPVATSLSQDTEVFRVMSYNIKNSYQDYDGWLERREEIIKLINDYQPALIGMQEVDNDWLDYLEENLDDYGSYSVGRDSGSSYDEHNSIFYLKSRFKLIEGKTYWLSETPTQESRGWDGACNRIASAVTLIDKETGKTINHYNTHLDHESDIAREKGYQLIKELIADSKENAILTGDFNEIDWSDLYKQAATDFTDVKSIATETMDFGTINYFTKFNFKHYPAIDYIFTTKGDFEVERYAVVVGYNHNGLPISDHFPIFSDLKLVNE